MSGKEDKTLGWGPILQEYVCMPNSDDKCLLKCDLNSPDNKKVGYTPISFRKWDQVW